MEFGQRLDRTACGVFHLLGVHASVDECCRKVVFSTSTGRFSDGRLWQDP